MKKYPKGTKIIYTPPTKACKEAQRDSGSIGYVVSYGSSNTVAIMIPTSQWTFSLPMFTWRTSMKNIKKVSEVGDQLLFSFMEQSCG